VDPRAGLDDLEKKKFLTLPGLELPALSQSLYRLSYPGSFSLYIHLRPENQFLKVQYTVSLFTGWAIASLVGWSVC
jgi:hypothetical protein